MRKKLIFYNIIIAAFALILMFGLGLLVTKNNNTEQAEKNIINLATIYANNYATSENFTKEVDENIRITVVDSNGVVLADSKQIDIASMENHLSREEIQAALNDQPQIVIRESDTIGTKMMYYAVKVPVDGDYVFIRIATTIESVNAYVIKTIPLTLIILALALFMSVIISTLISNKVTEPFAMVKDSLQAINDGKYFKILPTSKYDEVNSMLIEINNISGKVEKNIYSLKEESGKLDYIINNINDGIIAVDKEQNLCLINSKANVIFNCNTNLTGKNINCLTFDGNLLTAISECLENKQNTVFELTLDRVIYLVTVKNLGKGWQNDESSELAVVILSDITTAKNNEKLRSDFFANASHELKTPLTSIKGFNELMQLSNTDKALDKHISQIAKEADRMLILIDDMLKLSQLENTKNIEAVEVDLIKTTKDVIESLSTIIADKKVIVTINGAGAVNAETEHIYELIKNLCENAVKYNINGGKINISIKNVNGKVYFEIADTGIGIDTKHQTRIFERFYRVEKSRSRATGGTGLGLSIVKHICLLYKAEITLKSKIGIGTTIIIEFPKAHI